MRGFSLLEVLLASALSVVLLSTLGSVYCLMRHNDQLGAAWARVQESGRFVSYYLYRAAHQDSEAACETKEQHYHPGQVPAEMPARMMPDSDVLITGKCKQYAYFIGSTYRHNPLGQMIYALYEKPLFDQGEHKSRELVEGIEHLQVLYGIASAGGQDIGCYVAGSDIPADSQVRSVQIEWVMNSVEPVAGRGGGRLLHKTWSLYIAQ